MCCPARHSINAREKQRVACSRDHLFTHWLRMLGQNIYQRPEHELNKRKGDWEVGRDVGNMRNNRPELLDRVGCYRGASRPWATVPSE